MGFLPVIVGVEDENGDRIDAQRSDGTRAPIVLRLSAGMTHSYEFDGGLTRVIVGISASAFYTLKDDGAAVPQEQNLDFINFELTDVPGTDTTEIRHAIDNYVDVTGTVLTLDEAALTSIVLGHAGAPVYVEDNLDVTGDVTITGDLTVEGATTSIETTVLDIEDRVIHVNHSAGANDPVPAAMAGLGVHRGAAAGVVRDHAAWVWEEASSWWRAALNTSGDDSTVGADLGVRCLSLWLTGTDAVTIDKDTVAPVFTQEDVSSGDAQELTMRAGGTTDDNGDGGHLWLRSGDGGAVSGVGGDVNLVPAGGSVLGATRIWDGAETEVVTIDATTMALSVDVEFAAAHATPTISQAANPGTGVVTCEALSLLGQPATGNAGANAKTGGPTEVRGGWVTGTGSINTGGYVLIVGGDTSGGTSNVGGNVLARPGFGTQTNGVLRLQDGDENTCLLIDAVGELTLSSATAIGLSKGLLWGASVSAPTMGQAPDIGTGVVVADSTTMQAQGATGDAGANAKTGGPYYIAGGDVTGTGSVNTGGEVGIIGGSALGGTQNTGGPVYLRAGYGDETNGVAELRDGNDIARVRVTNGSQVELLPGSTVTTIPTTVRAPIVQELFTGDQTTDATIKSALIWSTETGEVINFTVEVTMRSATDGDSGGVTIKGVAENTGGTLAIIGTPTAAPDEAQDATWGTVQGSPVIVNASGADLRVRVEGGAGDTVNWNVALRVVRSQAT